MKIVFKTVILKYQKLLQLIKNYFNNNLQMLTTNEKYKFAIMLWDL